MANGPSLRLDQTKGRMPASPYAEQFGQRVRQRRLACGLSQKAVADALAWPQGHVSRLEQGEFLSVRLEKLHVLADLLDTTIDALVGRTPMPKLPASQEVCHE
jgi:transcriptional regulator with XRE-family HTH domain